MDELVDLARSGAPGLALQLMDQGQPALEQDATGWMGWERARIETLLANGRQERVVERVGALPEGLPDYFRQWAATQRAAALLDLGKSGEARERLRRLIWSTGEPPPPEVMAGWRRLVIRSYLLEGRVEDAHAAMLRYQQDYGDGGEEWRRLRARVLIRAGRFDDALQLLDGDKGDEGQLLYLLAGLRLDQEDAEAVRRAAVRIADAANSAVGARSMAQLLAAEAAEKGEDTERSIRALEQLFGGHQLEKSLGELFDLDVGRLWRDYEALGSRLGNERQLLIGQDEEWFQAARSQIKRHPTRAAALFTVLAFNARDPQRAVAAHLQLVRLIGDDSAGRRLVRRLYLEAPRFPTLESVPEVVRFLLLDHALADGDIPLASRLMASLPRPPAGSDADEWSLRRARVLILGGQDGAGIELLEGMLAGEASLPAERIDRLLQVLFDLQAVGRHREAVGLFRRLLVRGADDRQRREIYYWLGDSHKALGEYAEAARLYLKSAGLFDPYALDQWAQSARYAAAEALAEAGLADDARVLYQRLLAVTKDPARKAVLRHKLQELWLVR
ncbi:tetratricopeptide repeat protein [Endothiovibrio diazotrophicus]